MDKKELKEEICDTLSNKNIPKYIDVELSWDVASGDSIELRIKDKEDIRKFIEYTKEHGWPPEVFSDLDDEYIENYKGDTKT